MAEYIERNSLIKFVTKYTPHINRETTMDCVIRAIKEAPAADVVEDKHGYWIRKHIGNGWDDWDALTCSECGRFFRKPNFPLNYCPYCGTNMKEDVENGL